MKKITQSRQSLQRQKWTCITIYMLIISFLLAVAEIFSANSVLFFVLLLLTGFLSWTYLEYHLHRFWTHNKTSKSTKLAYKRHVHHHQHPTDIKVTKGQRIVLFGLSSLSFAASIKWNNYFTLFSGFFIGFAYSFFSHWMLHQPWAKKLFPRLLRFHILHHYKYPDHCYGFSTTLWDDIFHTTPPKTVIITGKIFRFYYGQEDHSDSPNNS